MLAQHTDESFRADHVRFRNAGGAVVQVLMRSDFFATEAFFCDHGRHPFLEQRRGPGGFAWWRRGSCRAAHRIVAQSRATRHRAGRHFHQEKPDPPWARLFRAQGSFGLDGAGGCKARLTKCESGRTVKAERAGVTPGIARSISNVFTQTEDSRGRASGTDGTSRPGNRRDGQLQARAAGDLRWPL
jgi:hypothetical protein